MAKRYQDLVAWQLAEQLRREVIAFTGRPAVARDRQFCDQIRDAAASGPNNITEGFLRYSHRDFARFALIARSSIGETQTELGDARDRRYLSEADYERLRTLAERALAAVTGLHTYLRTTPDPNSPTSRGNSRRRGRS
jgi:four helix bundle protein